MIVVNKALTRPLLIMGVEKRLVMLNALLSFPLVAATHCHLPAALIGMVLFVALHVLCVRISKFDPHLALLFKRSTRYSLQGFFPATSHPMAQDVRAINSVSCL